jgi:putative membrane protein
VNSMIQETAAWAANQTGWAGGWAGPWWFLIPLLWIALLASIVWLVIRSRRSPRDTPLDRAIEILAARFARGEIETDEYRRRLDEIRGQS